ncbi:MAG: 3-hydroxyacyl-ACP dehydratase FabZ [Deltaproteobacteria bacterium]|nr:3-hydroxyacyl-ACP dehydratase FabZ [Deltaproteobacteria bacterium]
MAPRPEYNLSVIQDILPHRSPFLFVDRVLEIEFGKRIIAEKDLTPDAFFFTGHFPGRPVMPGVLVVEALAQASGLLLGLTWRQSRKPFYRPDKEMFLANVNVKFISTSGPGDTLRLQAAVRKAFGRLFSFDVTAFVKGHQTAKGSLTLAQEEKR